MSRDLPRMWLIQVVTNAEYKCIGSWSFKEIDLNKHYIILQKIAHIGHSMRVDMRDFNANQRICE